eukprot:TRINITY_DN9918_c0_g1_i1.p2 TRINITY_DN9918_c0_g1~~TRINITY_DN9918_c0_g1_i1.p2  ORF type:complete len:147 (+),score=28.75 TRINITY_DN9918_c0_g1_i1:150-590(+)
MFQPTSQPMQNVGFQPSVSGCRGVLTCRVVSAQLQHDTEWIGKMSPYIVLKLGAEVQRTSTAQSAGKTPSFGDILTLRKFNDDFLAVEVWDQEKLSKDDIIGQGGLSLGLLKPGQNIYDVPIMYKGKNAGFVTVEIGFRPEVCQME